MIAYLGHLLLEPSDVLPERVGLVLARARDRSGARELLLDKDPPSSCLVGLATTALDLLGVEEALPLMIMVSVVSFMDSGACLQQLGPALDELLAEAGDVVLVVNELVVLRWLKSGGT
jgi:hypothetical protein